MGKTRAILTEERREAARRLRECTDGNMENGVLDSDVLDALEVGEKRDGLSDAYDVLALADIIDEPRCTNIARKRADEFWCSVCGEHVDIAYVDSCDGYHAQFCPRCGTEVG